jgi:hypothetical protein
MAESAAATIHAGINQYLENATPSVQDALKQNLITEADIDANLRGVFRVQRQRRRSLAVGEEQGAGAQGDGRVHRAVEE